MSDPASTMAEGLSRLRTIDPHLIDISLRESAAGARVGQTLADKLALLPKLRAFGLRDIVLGTLNYALPDELSVDDDFMAALRDQGADMTGCFALTSIGLVGDDGVFAPDASQLKLRRYGVPNTIHECYASRAGMAGAYDHARLRRSLPASVRWLQENLAGTPRILVNLVDGCDAFAEDPEATCALIRLLAELPIEGVSLEDPRGTYLPLQVGAFVAMARACLRPSQRLLVHLHAAAGYENASAMEALVRGADGMWASLAKEAAVSGHASLGELLANLARLGNPHVQAYRLDTLLPLVEEIRRTNGIEASGDQPVLGRDAYRLSLDFFRQRPDRAMDLVPETIGGTYRYRVCPVVSDPVVLAGRLAEVTGRAPEEIPRPVLERMVRLMRRSLRAGERIAFDSPEALLGLFATASAPAPVHDDEPQAPLETLPR